MTTETHEPEAPQRPPSRRVDRLVALATFGLLALTAVALLVSRPSSGPMAEPTDAPAAEPTGPEPEMSGSGAIEAEATEAETSAPATTEPAASEAVPSEAALALPAPTPELSVPATAPITTEEDARAIYDRLVAAAAALGAYPDPALVADVYTQSCPCFQTFHEFVTRLARNGHRSTGPVAEVIDFSAVRITDEQWRTRAVRQSADGGARIDAAGNVLQQYPPLPPEVVYTEIVRDGSLWKFSEVRFPPEEPTPWASPDGPAS